MGKIVFFEIENWEKDHIQKALGGQSVVFREDKLDEGNAREVTDATIISSFIYSKLDKTVLSYLPNLKLIVTRSTGFDHIDLAYCKEKGIFISNVPTYGAHTVAEHTFALILAISRKLVLSVERAKQTDFSLSDLRGFELYEKTIGVVGAGNIGKTVIKIALGFGMNVIIYTKSQHQDLKQIKGIAFVSNLDELLAMSDIVTLHVPHTTETNHLINMKNIAKFKKGSILINTARGGLVETQAILEGLDTGILQAVGIDVLEEECDLKEERELLTTEFLKTCDLKTQLLNHILLSRSNVLITPHNAFNSTEALQQILETTVSNIHSFLENKPKNLVQ